MAPVRIFEVIADKFDVVRICVPNGGCSFAQKRGTEFSDLTY
jgi:hypothetical protein